MGTPVPKPDGMSDRPRHHRYFLLAIYVAGNIYAASVFVDAGTTTYEFDGLLVTPSDVLFTCVIATSFLLAYALMVQPMLAGLVSRYAARGPVRRGGGIGLVVLAILAGQIGFSIASGSQVAGQLMYIDSAWALLFLIFNGDYMFLAYYCFYRESKIFPVNMALYLASGLVRGWGGMFLIVGFLEIGRQLRLKKYRNILVILVAIALIAPGVNLMRNYVRAMGSDFRGTEMLSLFSPDVFYSYSDGGGPLAIMEATTEAILLRLQHIEVDLVTSEFREQIASLYDKGIIRPYYAEGTVGRLVVQLFGEGTGRDLHQFLPVYFHGLAAYGDVGYNVHAGLGSWLAILGIFFPFLVLYSCFMICIAALLIRWGGGTKQADDVAWLMALLFISSGWFGPYEAFLQALVLVIGIEALIACISLASRQTHRDVEKPSHPPSKYLWEVNNVTR